MVVLRGSRRSRIVCSSIVSFWVWKVLWTVFSLWFQFQVGLCRLWFVFLGVFVLGWVLWLFFLRGRLF